jgi:hypothetical protein
MKKSDITHVLIPDCQIKPGVEVDHLEHIGKLIHEIKPAVVVVIGDFYDMPSLSSFDKGKRIFEGRRYSTDIDTGNEALEKLTRTALKGLRKKPRLVFCCGNHEYRIERAIDNQPELAGKLGYGDLAVKSLGWQFVPFLKPIEVDGIQYCHFFPLNAKGNVSQTRNGSPNADTQLARVGQSCTSGHLQGLSIANRSFNGRLQWGLIAGSCYSHSEQYLSPQGNSHFRGIVVKRNVVEGNYNPEVINLDALKRLARQ